MKHVVSISLGSSRRDKRVETEILGERVLIERIGTDGDQKKAREKYLELDGKVDCFGIRKQTMRCHYIKFSYTSFIFT